VNAPLIALLLAAVAVGAAVPMQSAINAQMALAQGHPLYGDLHPRFGWPGGCNDVDELATFIRALFKVGYLADGKKEKPWVGFEVKPQTDRETPEQVIAGTKRVWEEAWALA